MIFTTKQIARVKTLVKKTPTCWLWQGGLNVRSGYGQVTLGGKTYRAHRVLFVIYKGVIPNGLWVLHTCDNPACVNPKHLFLGTAQDNTNDMLAKGRQGDHTPNNPATGIKHGSKTHPEKLARGIVNGNSKLTESEVRNIRKLYQTGNWSHRKLGIKFGVAHNVIRSVIIRQLWAHID